MNAAADTERMNDYIAPNSAFDILLEYERLSLETGAAEAFIPAQRLYESAGFIYCGPFEGYRADPNSVFMTMEIV